MHTFAPFLIVMLAGSVPIAAAHTTVSVGQYDIEVGWGIEPPVKGLRNDFVIEVRESGDVKGVSSGVINAFREMSATVIFGGEEKTLDVGSKSIPGHYISPVIPTETGSYSIEFSGKLNGVDVQVNVPIEDVEGTAVLDFPASKTGSDPDIAALKTTMSALQQQIREMPSKMSGEQNDGQAYDLAVFGISFGIAGTVLAVIAMIRKK